MKNKIYNQNYQPQQQLRTLKKKESILKKLISKVKL